MEIIELQDEDAAKPPHRLQVITSGTVKHDLWMHQRIRTAGLETLVMADGETPAAFVDRVLAHVIESGNALVLLGGLLMPADMPVTAWTPEIAAASTRLLENVTDPQEKTIVRGLIAEALIGFFQSGLVSLMTSRTSSTTGAAIGGVPGNTRASDGR